LSLMWTGRTSSKTLAEAAKRPGDLEKLLLNSAKVKSRTHSCRSVYSGLTGPSWPRARQLPPPMCCNSIAASWLPLKLVPKSTVAV
jgi:hypothetical protein